MSFIFVYAGELVKSGILIDDDVTVKSFLMSK